MADTTTEPCEIPTVELVADTGEAADDDTPFEKAVADAARGGTPAPLADPDEQQLVEDLTPWLPALKEAAGEAAGGYVDCAIPAAAADVAPSLGKPGSNLGVADPGPAAASPGTAGGGEPSNGAMLRGFVDGNPVGVWHRSDGDDPWEKRRWYSTYCGGPTRPYTWAEAVKRGAHWAHSLHTSPTQDAYDRACAALEKHRQRANDAEAALAARDGEVQKLRDQLAGRDIELSIAYDEFKQLREQRTAPGLLRWCEWPGCLAHYNAVTGPHNTGGTWLRLRTTGVICPGHAERGHMPSWAWRPDDDYVTAICSCGESAEVRPTNLSAAQTWWAETHLPEIGAAS